MTAALAHTEAHSPPAPDRLRLLAVGLCAWHDNDPIRCSSVRGESGAGSKTKFSGRQTNEARDALLLKLERDANEDEQLLGLPDDRNVIEMARFQNAKRHGFWGLLDGAMTTLRSLDSWGWRLISYVYVDAGNPLKAMLRANSLKFLTRGDVPVTAPRYDLVRAMVSLSDLLPSEIQYPRIVHLQREYWDAGQEEALGLLRKNGKPENGSRGARAWLAALVVEAKALGLSQADIARKFGVEPYAISRLLKSETVDGEVVKFHGRTYRDVTENYLG